MIEIQRLCDFCGSEMPKPKNISEMRKSATKEWNMKSFDICETCALKIDNALLKFKNNVLVEQKRG